MTSSFKLTVLSLPFHDGLYPRTVNQTSLFFLKLTLSEYSYEVYLYTCHIYFETGSHIAQNDLKLSM